MPTMLQPPWAPCSLKESTPRGLDEQCKGAKRGLWSGMPVGLRGRIVQCAHNSVTTSFDAPQPFQSSRSSSTTRNIFVNSIHSIALIYGKGKNRRQAGCNSLTREGIWVEGADEDAKSWWTDQWFNAKNATALEVLANMKDVPGVIPCQPATGTFGFYESVLKVKHMSIFTLFLTCKKKPNCYAMGKELNPPHEISDPSNLVQVH